jgi:YaaC-like Protein
MNVGLSWIGSFQDTRLRYESENPLEEVWSHIARYGTMSYLARLQPNRADIPWDEYRKYIQVRIRQAVELRQASHAGTILSAPLVLYYSFLNLTRALMAMGPEIMPKGHHGLKFLKGPTLLSSSAQLQEGTFTQYLETQGIRWTAGQHITLDDALGCIYEVLGDYLTLNQPKNAHIQLVGVDAKMRGPLTLIFHNYPGNFAEGWRADFPQLEGTCKFVADQRLEVVIPGIGAEAIATHGTDAVYGTIHQYLHERFWCDLRIRETPAYMCLRTAALPLKLNRASYYYIAAFIMGSAVRYEPELVLAVAGTDSEEGLMLRRFLKQAERYFPNLKLNEQFGRQVYF